MRTIESYERSSLLYWFPRIQELSIPMPKTAIYEIPKKELIDIRRENGVPITMAAKVKPIADQFGYPLFLKTDQAAGKHSWNASCYVQSEEVLQRHIFEVIEANLNADILGLPFKALVFREYIPLESTFTAFRGEMPIAKERRYFIRDGEIECHHPYWPEDAIAEWASHSERNEAKLPKNWKELLKDLNKQSPEEIDLLSTYAMKVAKVLDGWWSVDFAKSKLGEWLLIDMATGAESFHDITCEYCPEEIRKQYAKEEPIDLPEVVLMGKVRIKNKELIKKMDELTHVAGITVSCPHCGKQLHLEFNRPMKKESAAKLVKKVEKIFTFEEVQKEFDERKKKEQTKTGGKNGKR